jgi:hypothetical protein
MRYLSRFLRSRLIAFVWICGLLIPPCCASSQSFQQVPPSEDTSTIFIVGDVQRTGFWERVLFREQNDSERNRLMSEIGKEMPSAVIFLGDCVATGGDEKCWEMFDALTATIRGRSIPAFEVVGNHEYAGSQPKGLRLCAARFPLIAHSTWYSVRSGGTAIIVLNSNFSKLSSAETSAQSRWYREAIVSLDADSSVNAIIVCTHHPPYTNSTIVSASADVRREFVPPFLASPKTVLFLSGHAHAYEHFLVQGKNFVVSGGGGGPRQKLVVNPKKRQYDDLYNGPAIRPFHFLRLERTSGWDVISMMALDGPSGKLAVGDSFRVEIRR